MDNLIVASRANVQVDGTLIIVKDFATKANLTASSTVFTAAPNIYPDAEVKATTYCNSDSKDGVSIYLKFQNVDSSTFRASFRLTKGDDERDVPINVREYDTIASSCYASRRELEKWFHEDGSLHYECFITTKSAKQQALVDIGCNNRFLAAFERSQGADVTLILAGKSIEAAKFMLVTQSKVFEAMFAQPWKDTDKMEIVIEDVEYEPMYELLKAMYVGYARPSNVLVALKMFAAADKYQVTFISNSIVEYLASNISLDNVLLVFREAELRNCSSLLDGVAAFVSRTYNVVDVTKLPGFDCLDKAQCALLIQFVCSAKMKN